MDVSVFWARPQQTRGAPGMLGLLPAGKQNTPPRQGCVCACTWRGRAEEKGHSSCVSGGKWVASKKSVSNLGSSSAAPCPPVVTWGSGRQNTEVWAGVMLRSFSSQRGRHRWLGVIWLEGTTDRLCSGRREDGGEGGGCVHTNPSTRQKSSVAIMSHTHMHFLCVHMCMSLGARAAQAQANRSRARRLLMQLGGKTKNLIEIG
mmetsp:Transcript_40957/g.83659  ORF Transcript_40957/g.83659 Transcript_40957/m.83659 type:complete len:203 (-) Transcript_40957:748-1356(-)